MQLRLLLKSPSMALIDNQQVMIIEGFCVSVAMYCLIQFYIQVKTDLAEHQPLLKVAAIKLVIFLSFWQNVGISRALCLPEIGADDSSQSRSSSPSSPRPVPSNHLSTFSHPTSRLVYPRCYSASRWQYSAFSISGPSHGACTTSVDQQSSPQNLLPASYPTPRPPTPADPSVLAL